MILDTSALVAVLFGEPEADVYTQLIYDADRCLISAGSFLELSIVIERQTGPEVARQCDMFFLRPRRRPAAHGAGLPDQRAPAGPPW